jgi:hypothetical protein
MTVAPTRPHTEPSWQQAAAIIMIALVNVANVASRAFLIDMPLASPLTVALVAARAVNIRL